MSIFYNWILQAILIDEALDSLQKLDKDELDSDMQEIVHCSDCANWKKSENANNVGDCTLRNEPMFSGDFCSKAERNDSKEFEFTEDEKLKAKHFQQIGLYKVEYCKDGNFFWLYMNRQKPERFSVYCKLFQTMIEKRIENCCISLYEIEHGTFSVSKEGAVSVKIHDDETD